MIDSAAVIDRPSEIASNPRLLRTEGLTAAALLPSLATEINAIDNRIGVEWVAPRSTAADSDRARHLLYDLRVRVEREASLHPNSARARASFGLTLLSQGDVTAAERELRAALSVEATHYVAAMGLAKLLVVSGRLDEGARLYDRLRDRFSGDAGILIGLADVARQRGDFAKAGELLKQVPDSDSRASVARYELGMILLRDGFTREALTQLKDAVRADPRSAGLHVALGAAYAVAGELKKAKRAFVSARALSPRLAEASYGLARIFLHEGDVDAALDVLTEQVAQVDEPQGRELLALVLFRKGRFAGARGHLVEVLSRLQPSSDQNRLARARLLNNLGVVHYWSGEADRAEGAFRSAIDTSRSSPLPYRNLAKLYAKSTNWQAAREILTQARGAFPTDAEIAWLLALVRVEQNESEPAAQELEQFLRDGGATPEVFAILGGVLADDLEDREKAHDILREGWARFPANPKIANNLAYVELLLGDANAARSVLSAIGGPEKCDVHWMATWGLLLIWEGQVERGRQLYEEAARVASSDGNSKLAAVVRQKMHLELARSFVRRDDAATAHREVMRGLAGKGGKRAYERDLKRLAAELR
jgi:tetratricopeptide (TPR) repeat protein